MKLTEIGVCLFRKVFNRELSAKLTAIICNFMMHRGDKD